MDPLASKALPTGAQFLKNYVSQMYCSDDPFSFLGSTVVVSGQTSGRLAINRRLLLERRSLRTDPEYSKYQYIYTYIYSI